MWLNKRLKKEKKITQKGQKEQKVNQSHYIYIPKFIKIKL